MKLFRNERRIVCLLVGFHGEDTCALRRQVLVSRALGWTGRVYHTTTLRSLILGIRGTNTLIEGHLTHQLRV
jgi:hypothetical protein